MPEQEGKWRVDRVVTGSSSGHSGGGDLPREAWPPNIDSSLLTAALALTPILDPCSSPLALASHLPPTRPQTKTKGPLLSY